MRLWNAFYLMLAGVIGITAAVLLTVALVEFGSPRAEATPALAKGKPCGTCHSSGKPSKGDLKK